MTEVVWLRLLLVLTLLGGQLPLQWPSRAAGACGRVRCKCAVQVRSAGQCCCAQTPTTTCCGEPVPTPRGPTVQTPGCCGIADAVLLLDGRLALVPSQSLWLPALWPGAWLPISNDRDQPRGDPPPAPPPRCVRETFVPLAQMGANATPTGVVG